MEDLKIMVRWLLISSRVKMNIWQLNEEYKKETGEWIPFKKLGFSSLEELLRSMTDILEVRERGKTTDVIMIPYSKRPYFELRPYQRRSVSHDPACSKSVPNPPRLFNHYNAPPSTNPRNAHNKVPLYTATTTPSNHGTASTVTRNTYSSTGAIPKTIEGVKYKNKTIRNPSPINVTDKDVFRYGLNEDLALKSSFTDDANNTKAEVLNSDGNLYSHRTGLKNNPINEKSTCVTNKDDDEYVTEEANDSFKALAEKYVNYRVPLKVQKNLKALISKYPHGIWCGDLSKAYKEMFGSPLEYRKYHYASLIQMYFDLEHIFYCYRPARNDFVLYDKTEVELNNLQRKLETNVSFRFSTTMKSDMLVTEPCSSEPAIVNIEEFIDDEQFIFPSGVMTYEDTIRRLFLPPSTNLGDYINVWIGEIYDPSKFWISFDSSEFYMIANDLQLIHDFPVDNLKIPSHVFREGLYCVAKYANEYSRAVIVKLDLHKKIVTVFYIDYGTLASINMNDVSFLHKKFSHLPAQAIRARLANIWPPVASSPWSNAASKCFRSLILNKIIVASVFRIDTEMEIVELENTDINDTLVKKGFAITTNEAQQPRVLHLRKIPKYTNIQLYPTFDDIENGNVPSASDASDMIEAGKPYDQIFPNDYQDNTNVEDFEETPSSLPFSVPSAPLSNSITATTNPRSSPKSESCIQPVSLERRGRRRKKKLL